MADQNTPLQDDLTEEEVPSPAPVEEPADEQPPKPQSEYTTKQRVIALLGAIFVILVTLMYAYSIATGDIFRR